MKNELINITELSEQSKKFIDYLDVSPLTIKAYKDGIISFINYLDENDIKEPTRSDFKAYRDSLKGKLATNTINSYLTANRVFFNYLESNGIYKNITKDVKSLKTSNVPIRQTLTLEQSKEIYNKLTSPRERCLFSLAITTGLRANEIALAKIENIKMYNNELVLFVKCKKRDDESEYVKLSQQVLKDIKDYIGDRTSGYIFISTSNHNNNGGVTNTSIRRFIKEIFKRFGIDENGFSCHSLRRTFCQIAYLNGADLVSIQSVLHHSSLVTTRRYLQQTIRDENHTEQNMANLILN